MKISVFGLGYVGAVSAACLAHEGHDVIGVDTNPIKVDMVNIGAAPVVETGVSELIENARRSSSLKATLSCREAVLGSDVAFVCVGTPSRPNGSIDLSHLERVCSEIGEALRDRTEYFVVVIRSTIVPGTMRDLVIPTLERASDKVAGHRFGACVNPEFLREGSAVADFFDPPKVVLGAIDDRTRSVVESLLRRDTCPFLSADLETVELVKYADNAWHGLKVAFANEMGVLAKSFGVDGRELMRLFCQDTKLNVSTAYLRPGLAFGGSCLPKDLRALSHRARVNDLDLPVMNSILRSNREHLDRAFRMISDAGNRRVGVLGLSFKFGTDDLRESPVVDLVERLIGKGFDLRIYDDSVALARLIGANREYLLTQIPHIADLLVDSVDDVIAHGDTLVIAKVDPAFEAIATMVGPDHRVVDFVLPDGPLSQEGGYSGICW